MMAALLALALLLPTVQAHAASQLADGTYTADYLVLKAEDDSVSMANDYWEKPATVIMNNGKATIQLTVNHSMWVTEFKVPGSGDGYIDTKIIETNKKDDKRRVEFTASNISEPILSKIHVTVEEIDYDHDYTIRMSFKMDSFKLVKAADKAPEAAATAKPAATSKPAATAAPAATKKPAAEPSQAAATASPTAKPAEPTAAPTATETVAAEASVAPAASDDASKDAQAEAQPEQSAQPEETAAQADSAASDDQGKEEEAVSGGAELTTADSATEAASDDELTGTAIAAEATEQGKSSGSSVWWIIAAGAIAALAAGLVYNARKKAARRDK
jgi:heme uptake protein IsdC